MRRPRSLNGSFCSLLVGVNNPYLSETMMLIVRGLEGIPTIVIAPLAFIFLPKGPDECPFLTERENNIVRLRALSARGHEEKGRLNLKQVCAAFYDYKNYLQAVIIFCLNVRVLSPPPDLTIT